MANRRRKGRHRGAAGKANADLTAHIRSVGLETVGEYQAWCRERGFNGALNKTWQERRQERRAAVQAADVALAERALQMHIKALRLQDAAAYTAWCTAHGLSTGTHKSAAQRKKECDLAERLKSEAVLAQMKAHTRRPQDAIRDIFAGKMAAEDLNRPHLQKMQAAFDRLGRDRKARRALLQVLLHVEKHADLFDVKPAIQRFGPQAGNTLIEGLGALASRHKFWVRDPGEWRPDSHNARRQFSALARHLLARYEVPRFMDSAWFLSEGPDAQRQQDWFIHIGSGQNIRKADVPVRLTKMMAHLFLQAPDGYTVYEALRWGQILGLGGDEGLVRAVNGTLLGTSFEYEDFWQTVVHFFVNHPMLDPDQVGPLVDYIQALKFTPREEAGPDGTVETLPPEQPNFSVKGRSMDKLLRQMEGWHRHLARDARLPARTWAPSGIGAFDWTDRDKYGRDLDRWVITELLTAKALSIEGREMHHCVGSYANNCKKGNTSVWSMQVETPDGEKRRVMTVAVNNGSRSVTQARGKCNALPSGKTPNGKRKDFDRHYEHYLRKTRRVLFLWREQEGLSMSRNA